MHAPVLPHPAIFRKALIVLFQRDHSPAAKFQCMLPRVPQLLSLILAFAFLAGCAKERPAQSSSEIAPASIVSEDQAVLTAALHSLLKHQDFGYRSERDTRTNIILISSNPEKFGIAEKHQVEMDTDRKVPDEEFASFEARNRVPGTYDTIPASYTDRVVAPPIFIYDDGDRFSDRRFDNAFPNARGWMQPYLPGYSRDGKRAFVRGWIGPSPHGATYTATLEKKSNGQWVVTWEKIARYV